MSTAAKYTFDVEFQAAGDLPSNAARQRQKRVLTQEEIEALCALARNDGLNTGQVRALEACAAGTRDATQAIAEALAQTSRDLDSIRAEAAQIALAAARKLARAALAAMPAAEVEAMLCEAMHQAIGEPRIVLRAAPDVAEAISSRVAELAHEQGFDGRVQVSGDPALARADCRIEWRGGGAERAEAAIETAIAELIARRFPANTTTQEQCHVGQ
jgi:flagellar assembly protein FliH